MKTTIKAGDRVEVPNPEPPATGCGSRGTVVRVWTAQSSVTGSLLRWVNVDVRLDTGHLVTRKPKDLRKEVRS